MAWWPVLVPVPLLVPSVSCCVDLASSLFLLLLSFVFFLFPFFKNKHIYFPLSFSLFFFLPFFLFSPPSSCAAFSLFPFLPQSGWRHPSDDLMRLAAGSRICVGGRETMLSRGSARCRPRSGSGRSSVSVGLQCAITPRVGKGQIVLVVGLGRDCRSQTESELGVGPGCWMEECEGKASLHPAEGSRAGCPKARVMGPGVWLKPTPL